jgi:hypothetical protein
VAAQEHEPEVDEVLAHAGAGVEQVLDRGADVGRAFAVLEAVGDQLAQQPQRGQRTRRARGVEELVEGAVLGLGVVGEQELAARRLVGGGLERLPALVGRLARLGGDHARAHVDREMVVRLGHAELDDLGAVVVEVALEARLGVHADVEVVDALRRGRRRAHAEGVEVVGDPALVAVLGQVPDREVHANEIAPRGIRPRVLRLLTASSGH